jgi:hypothetical protein
VPVEFELSRARQMIKDLDPEIHRNALDRQGRGGGDAPSPPARRR